MKLLAAEVATLYGDSLLWSYLRRLEESYFRSTEVLKVELEDLEEGGIFAKLGIKNFLEADFFAWYLNEWDNEVADAVIEVIRKLSEYEPATAELEPDTIRDLFKELYENLVPQTVRHDLGEYYTPDWLAELILKEIGYSMEYFEELTKQKGIEAPLELRVLDPACGSGTFLVAAIAAIKEYAEEHFLDKGLVLEKITQNIVGFDLNPLAVMTAKTNYLLAVGDLLRYRRRAIELPIYLADSIFIERREAWPGKTEDKYIKTTVGTYVLKTTVKEFQIPISVIEKNKLNRVLSIFEESLNFKADKGLVKAKLKILNLTDDEIAILINLYEDLLDLERKRKDKIWTRVIRNAFAPLLKGKFDYIIGNPPWLTYLFVGSVDYQKALKNFIAQEYSLTREAENILNMELATLFFARCLDLYMNNKGKIGFVMPRSVLYADQHKNFREGKILRVSYSIRKILDLNKVAPLFHVPACVIIATKGEKVSYPVNATIIEGRLPKKNLRLSEAKMYLMFTNTYYYLYRLGERSWISEYSEELSQIFSGSKVRRSPYYERFAKGADILPRSFWFVDVLIEPKYGINTLKPYIRSSKRAMSHGKDEYKNVVLEGNVEADFLYAVFTSTELVPFGHLPPVIAIMPVVPTKTGMKLITAAEALELGYIGLYEWLRKCEDFWEKVRGKKALKESIYSWINYRRKLTRQSPNVRFKVLYPDSASYLVATAIDILDPEILTVKFKNTVMKLKGVIIDHSVFYYETNNRDEAYYLVAVLNSRVIDKLIKPMQAKGAFGPRGIKKKVLELPIPEYNPNNPIHKRLVELGIEGTKRVKEHLPKILNKYRGKVITPSIVGKIRNEIRKIIEDIVKEIDNLVLELLKDVTKAAKPRTLMEYFDMRGK